MTDVREMTAGEKAVGLTFNPSGDPMVTQLKQLYAQIIDVLYEASDSEPSNEKAQLFHIAVREAQGAQMWAVKAATWRG